MNKDKFRETVWMYYKKHKRNFPWRETREFYNILVSEIMLQQTQVTRVTYKYQEFLAKFKTLESLARSPLHDVLRTWIGLGYNRRARALHECAKQITEKHKGQIPKTYSELVALPGIGQSTAGALLNFVWNIPTPFIETNIRTVYLHHFFKNSKHKIPDKEILKLVDETLPRPAYHASDGKSVASREWFYALYDYGTFLKQTLKHDPAKKSLTYKKQSTFKGSFRAKRAHTLKKILEKNLTQDDIKKIIQKEFDSSDGDLIISALLKDKMIKRSGRLYSIS